MYPYSKLVRQTEKYDIHGVFLCGYDNNPVRVFDNSEEKALKCLETLKKYDIKSVDDFKKSPHNIKFILAGCEAL